MDSPLTTHNIAKKGTQQSKKKMKNKMQEKVEVVIKLTFLTPSYKYKI